jgi:hypothetical protein
MISANMIIDGAEKNMITDYTDIKQQGYKIYTIENGEFVGESLPVKGKLPNSGTIRIDSDGTISVALKNDKWCAIKGKNDSKVTITDDVENCAPEGVPEIGPDICFTFENGTITNYDFYNPECPRDLKIPEKINGENVTAIGDYAFTIFDWNAFKFRGSLTSVVIPDTVTYIGEGAFKGWDDSIANCNGNITSLTLPNKVEYIGMEAFACNKIKSVTIPSSLTELSQGIFWNNRLRSINIPENILSIGWLAFASNQISNLTIPNTVLNIRDGAFNDNQLPDSQAFIYARNLDGTINNTKITSYAGANRGHVEIPNNVEHIGNSAFSNCQITSVSIPDNVKLIDGYAFEYNRLTNVTIPNTVITIGWYAFRGNQLTSVTIKSGVGTIEYAAFMNNQLTSVIIPDSVRIIEGYAFANNQLTSVTIPGNVNLIGNYAFGNNGIQTLTIEEGVKEIHWGAFSDNQITNLSLPSSIEYIGNAAFNNNQLPDNQAFIYAVVSPGVFNNTKIISYGGAKRENVVIPNSVERIGMSAFHSCQLMSVTIGSGITYIGSEAFRYNYIPQGNLTINRAEGTVEIAGNAFDNNGEDGVTPITPKYLVQ